MILEIVPVGYMDVNCYVLASKPGSRAVIIDPGEDAPKIFKALKKHNLSPGIVINTHGHFDHIRCNDEFKVPVYIHKEDLPMLKEPKLNLSAFFANSYTSKSKEIHIIEEGAVVGIDGISLKVLHIPGHSPGGIALVLQGKEEKMVFTGDTLFCKGIGRSDLERGDGNLLIRAIKAKLLSLPEETIVYPGHGESSTIGAEKDNPYLNA